MRRHGRIRRRSRATVGIVAIALAIGALAASGCLTIRAGDGGVVWGSNIVVEEGEVAHNDLVAFGGTIRIDGEARRDVVVIGGTLDVEGIIGGDSVVVGGAMRMGSRARVYGDAVVVGGAMDRHPDAVVEGEVVNVGFGAPSGPFVGGWYWPGGWYGADWLGISALRAAFRTTQLIYWLLLAVLTVALVGDRVSSAAHAIAREPVRLGAIGVVGFLALLLAVVLFLLLSIVLLGIPFLIATLLGWWLAYIFGMVAVFQLLGDRVARLLGRPQASQISLVLLGGAVLGILRYFPVFGTLLWWIGGFLGLGAVFATRFGSGRPWFRRAVSPEPAPRPPEPDPVPREGGDSRPAAESGSAEPPPPPPPPASEEDR